MDQLASSANLKAKTYFFLILMIVLGSVGNTILDKGMKGLGTIDFSSRAAIWQGAFQTFTSGTIWLGIGCMLLFMICHMLVLSWADYSFVMPFSAVTYALVPVLGYIWLGEQVPVTRRIGILLIVFGVFLVSRTPPRTTEPQAIAARSLS
jgi:multidrug transporter EmrE-like cation transporter